MNEVLLGLVFVGIVYLQDCRHDRERRRWEKERQALISAAVPTFVATIDPEPARAARPYGDADQYRIEQERRKARGLESEEHLED